MEMQFFQNSLFIFVSENIIVNTAIFLDISSAQKQTQKIKTTDNATVTARPVCGAVMLIPTYTKDRKQGVEHGHKACTLCAICKHN